MTSRPAATAPPAPLPAFAIFEGGGAKGIAHVGALEAARVVGLEWQGVAGASAGAIAAMLAATGMAPRQIFDPDCASADVFTARGTSPVELIGADNWRWFLRSRRLGGLLLAALAVSAALTLLVLLPWWGMLGLLGRRPPPLRLWRRFGLFDSTGARDFIDRVLREQLHAAYAAKGVAPPDPVCFRHLDPAIDKRLLPLRVIVTDVVDGKLVVFGPDTPDVPVADAVVASFSIPLVFRPAAVRGAAPGERYVDGGLVANLPTWVFNEDKRRFERLQPNRPPLPVVAFTLKDETAGAVRWLGDFAIRVVRTGVFGSQRPLQRLTPDLFEVDLPSPIPLLAFDCDRKAARGAWIAGHDEALTVLQRDLRNAPEAARAGLALILAEAHDRSDALRRRLGLGLLAQLRVAIVTPFGKESFRVRITAGMADDADDRLALDPRGPGAPRAFAARDIYMTDLAGITPAQRYMTKYEAALVRPTLRSIIAVPIFPEPGHYARPAAARPEPLGVLCLDSDELLEAEYDDAEFLAWLVDTADTLDQVVAQLRQRDEP